MYYHLPLPLRSHTVFFNSLLSGRLRLGYGPKWLYLLTGKGFSEMVTALEPKNIRSKIYQFLSTHTGCVNVTGSLLTANHQLTNHVIKRLKMLIIYVMTLVAAIFGVDNTFPIPPTRFVRTVMIKFDNHFSDLFENTSDLIQVLAYDGTIELVNSSWLKSLGYTEAEVIGNSVFDFVMPEYREQYLRQREELIDTDHYDRYVEVVFRGKDGKQLIGEGHTRRVVGEGGVIYTRGVFRDITSRRALEEHNFETQRRLKRFFEYAPDAVIIADEQQRITDWNLKAACTFGFSAREIMGSMLSDIIMAEKYREPYKEGVANFFKTGKGPVLNNSIEIEALHKNGNTFPISLSISNVKMGNEWMFVAFISDISERKQQEEKMRLQNESLNRIANIQSHEVRGPIASIMGLINLIKDDNYSVPKEYVEMMEAELHKLDERTRTIVGYANRPVRQAG